MDPLVQTGQAGPEIALPDLEGDIHHVFELRGRIGILNFWSAECPWSERTDLALQSYLAEWGNAVVWWAIAANANESKELLTRTARARGLPWVLVDAEQAAADRYGAQTTPHLFVLDPQGIVRYQGAFDDVTFRQRAPTRSYLYEAVQALLAGRQPDPAQTPAYGCSLVRYR